MLEVSICFDQKVIEKAQNDLLRTKIFGGVNFILQDNNEVAGIAVVDIGSGAEIVALKTKAYPQFFVRSVLSFLTGCDIIKSKVIDDDLKQYFFEVGFKEKGEYLIAKGGEIFFPKECQKENK
jgi:hypothetical protein